MCFVLFACVILTGCRLFVDDKVISSTDKVYEITKVKIPKNLYIDIVDVKSGKTYTNQYVAIYCKEWRKLKVGSQWTFKEVVYEGMNGPYVKIEGIRNDLCAALSTL
jgi:hypothetical protein